MRSFLRDALFFFPSPDAMDASLRPDVKHFLSDDIYEDRSFSLFIAFVGMLVTAAGLIMVGWEFFSSRNGLIQLDMNWGVWVMSAGVVLAYTTLFFMRVTRVKTVEDVLSPVTALGNSFITLAALCGMLTAQGSVIAAMFDLTPSSSLYLFVGMLIGVTLVGYTLVERNNTTLWGGERNGLVSEEWDYTPGTAMRYVDPDPDDGRLFPNFVTLR